MLQLNELATGIWMAWRRRSWRQTLVRLGVAFSVAPMTAVHGGASAVVLHYHFVAGQHLYYHLFGAVSEDLERPGQAPSHNSVQVNAITSYHITAVSASGVATAVVQIDSSAITETINGKSTVLRTDAVEAPQSTQTVLLGPDNSLPRYKSGDVTSNSYGGYGVQTIGLLPTYAVSPGMHWLSTARGNLAVQFQGELPTLHGVRITASDALTGYQQDMGQPVAALTSIAPISYTTDTLYQGRAVHVQVNGSITLHSLFDVTQKRLRSGSELADLQYVVTTPPDAGGKLLVRSHVVDTGSLQAVPPHTSL